MGALSGELEEVEVTVEETPKRKPYAIWKVDGKETEALGTPYTFVPVKDTTVEAVYEKKVEGAVQTGDTANAVPWIVCLGVAAGAGVVVLKSRKKRS